MLYDGYAEAFAADVREFHRSAIDPVCTEMARALAALPRGSDYAAINRWERQRIVQMETHRSFALGIGALWERNFRGYLRHSVHIVDDISSSLSKNISGGRWDEVEEAFERVRGFPLSWFPMYDDLVILHKLSSAIRHGDGKAADFLQDKTDGLFLEHDVRTGFFAYFTLGGEGPASINKLDIKAEALRHFTEVVASFWDAIEMLRQSGAGRDKP